MYKSTSTVRKKKVAKKKRLSYYILPWVNRTQREKGTPPLSEGVPYEITLIRLSQLSREFG